MDKAMQARLRDLLASTLDDARLSRGEADALDAAVEQLAADREALAYVRNTAFRVAKERIRDDPVATLAWLDRVDKIVDRQLAGGSGGAVVVDRVAFSPGESCLKLVRSSVRAARRSIDVCVFTITDDRISNQLLAAHRRGVAVRVISDDLKASDPGSDIARLKAAGIEVRVDRTPDHMHHKFAVVDDRLLLHGSYNWTRGAVENYENLHATTSPAVVEPFRRRFATLWRQLARG